MAKIFTKNTGSAKTDYAQPSDGTYMATIVRAIDLGTQPEEIMKSGKTAGQIVPAGAKVLFFVELVDFEPESEHPTTLLVERSVSFHEKANLTKDIKAFLSLNDAGLDKLLTTGFSLSLLLGKSALASVGKTATGKAKVLGFSQVMKGQAITPARSELLVFDIEDADKDVYAKLPEFVRKKIDASAENPIAGGGSDTAAAVKHNGGGLDL